MTAQEQSGFGPATAELEAPMAPLESVDSQQLERLDLFGPRLVHLGGTAMVDSQEGGHIAVEQVNHGHEASGPETFEVKSLFELEQELTELKEQFPPADRTKEVYSLIHNPDVSLSVEVVCDRTREDYKRITPDFVWKMQEQELDEIIAEANRSGRDRVFLETNTTKQGGGVAKLVPQFIHQVNLKGEEAREDGAEYSASAYWCVPDADPARSVTTKKLHNLQQDVLGNGERFTADDKKIHTQIGEDFFDDLMAKNPDIMSKVTDLLIDDFQQVAMIKALIRHRSEFPDSIPNLRNIMVRNHINTDRAKMDTVGSVQHDIKEYLHKVCGVELVDTYIAHPVDEFVPSDMDDKLAMIPPPTNELAELDMPLSAEKRKERLDWIDGQLKIQNLKRQIFWTAHYDEQYGEGNWDVALAHVDDQEPLDLTRPQITCWARPDFAKRQWLDMEIQKRVVDIMLDDPTIPEEKIPIKNVFGQGATDDTDTDLIHAGRNLRMWREMPERYRRYIRVGCFDHDYEAPNAMIRASMFTEHVAIREGFEHIPTEGIIKENDEGDKEYGNVPAVVTPAGGLVLQVEEGITGHVMQGNGDVVDNGDPAFNPYIKEGSLLDREVTRIAKLYVHYIMNPDAYRDLKKSTHDTAQVLHKVEFGPGANLVRLGRALNGKENKGWRMSVLRELPEYALAA